MLYAACLVLDLVSKFPRVWDLTCCELWGDNLLPWTTGWNIYQRKWFEKRQLTPGEWKREIKVCADAWCLLSQTEREAYEALASQEDGLRDNAKTIPFPSRKSKMCKNDIAVAPAQLEGLTRTALQKVSQSRLLETYNRFHGHESWDTWNGGLADATACLRLDLIDLESTDATIKRKWQHAVSEPVSSTLPSSNAILECHHEVCHELYGTCSTSPHIKLAGQFVHAMHHACAMGILARIYSLFNFSVSDCVYSIMASDSTFFIT